MKNEKTESKTEVFAIIWDTDGEYVEGLPDHYTFDGEVDSDVIPEELEDIFGYPVFSFSLNRKGRAPTKREFFVHTPLGDLHVYAKHDVDNSADYPGLYVDLIAAGNNNEELLACVEYDSSMGSLMTTVYQPGQDEPCEIVHHELPSLARVETGPDGKLRYFDKNGTEILHGMKIRWNDGDVDVAYRADNDELGIDATNPVLVQRGKMRPCEMGIYPFSVEDLQELEVLS